ncbi:hypothetical protein BDR06DRAFT_999377 [Suillus hirtellus]|nr:hypothetical protein BDR06DRAFT_999377 [Suillus hirtellus]
MYFASDEFARVLDSKSSRPLHSFEHNSYLNSVALSPEANVLTCVGINGVVQLWDTESNQPLGKPFHPNRDTLCYVSFSRDGNHLANTGDDGKLTLWMLKDIAPQLPAPTPPQQSDGQSTDKGGNTVDATGGGGGFTEEADDDPYNNFFQFSQQSLPSPSPGFYLPPLFSARRLLNIFSRHRPPPDEPVPQERSKRDSFSRRVRSDSSLELATTKLKPVPEGEAEECEGEQGQHIDDGCTHHCARRKETMPRMLSWYRNAIPTGGTIFTHGRFCPSNFTSHVNLTSTIGSSFVLSILR